MQINVVYNNNKEGIRNWLLGLKRTFPCQTLKLSVACEAQMVGFPFLDSGLFRARDTLPEVLNHTRHKACCLPPSKELQVILLLCLGPEDLSHPQN